MTDPTQQTADNTRPLLNKAYTQHINGKDNSDTMDEIGQELEKHPAAGMRQLGGFLRKKK